MSSTSDLKYEISSLEEEIRQQRAFLSFLGKELLQKRRQQKRLLPKTKVLGAPKRPTTAFLYFMKDKRSEVTKTNPEMSGPEVLREVARMWKKDFSTPESRVVWVEKANVDKARYLIEKDT